MKHLYKVTTPHKTFFTSADHLIHLYQKLKKDFGIYQVDSVQFIK